MLEMATRMEETQAGEDGGHRSRGGAPQAGPTPIGMGLTCRPNDRGMEVTRVTHYPVTVQVQLKREVVRPGWNQATMSQAELGEATMV